ncbi:hypothetical protein [Aquibacillus rhizosphaerae]|uniref:YtxH domain-containing protein n=1 Tax=Aquibacillus rhizosphaerae TaxID=3051431 RepID=A0ABT7L612_9BACI|nr:hypothetical protein [Aquibacillus sp. LR5S19]MDL4841307.1 hypothetical protein [Aquibacillus sp. LR5S19]
MKRKIIISTLSAVGAGTMGYILSDKDKRHSLKQKYKEVVNKTQSKSESLPIKEAGIPEADNQENAKMVDEGSQFGVDFYNKVKH